MKGVYMTNARHVENSVKNCMNPKCGQLIETFVRVVDKMFCSIKCAQDEGSLKQDWKERDCIIFSKPVPPR